MRISFDNCQLVLPAKKYQNSFTLIELIISIGIAALIISILLPLLSLFIQAITRYSVQDDMYFDASIALEDLRKDISCAMLPLSFTGKVFSLSSKEDSLKMDFFSAQPLASSSSTRDYEAKHIQYLWSKEESKTPEKELQPAVLHRIASSFRTGETNEVERTVWHNFAKIEVKMFLKENWTNSCELSNADGLPSRATIILHFPENTISPITSEFLIPAGISISKTNTTPNNASTNRLKI
jgi:type II secretory pathway pseudopilin PulG